MPDHSFVTASNTSGAADPITHTHAPVSPASVVVLSIIVTNTSLRTGADPTIGGVTATRAHIDENGLEQHVEMWYRLGTFSTSNLAISIGNTKLLPCFVEAVSAYAGAGYNSYLSFTTGLAYANGVADGLALSLTGLTSGAFVYARLGCGENATGSIAENSTTPVKTATFIQDHGAFCSWGSYGIASTAGNSLYNWTWSNDDGCAVGVAFGATSQAPPVPPIIHTKRGAGMSGGMQFQTGSVQGIAFNSNLNRYKNREG